MIVSTTLYALMLIVIPLLPRGQAMLYAAPMFLLGALATGFVVMVRAITADVGDELRLEGGRDLMALLYAVTSATTGFLTVVFPDESFMAPGRHPAAVHLRGMMALSGTDSVALEP